MISKDDIRAFVEEFLGGKDLFVVDVKVTPTNEIDIEIDSPAGVDIDDCVAISKAVEDAFDREKEDYELTVGSCGLTTPFKVVRQYQMHAGDPVEVLARDGKKYRGTLEAAEDEEFTLIVAEKVKEEGSKRPVIKDVAYRFTYDEVKSTKLLLD